MTYAKNPPMVCRSGKTASALPRFQKWDAPAPADPDSEDFREDPDELSLLDTSTNKRWFAIRTLANRERQLATMFRSMGLSYFLPMKYGPVRHAGKTEIAPILVFPGYVFGLFAPQDRLNVIKTRRVASLITVNGNAAQRHFQKELQALYEACKTTQMKFIKHRTVTTLRQGDEAEFIQGSPLQGRRCVITATRPNGRCEVQLKVAMLGASVFETHMDLLQGVTDASQPISSGHVCLV